MTVDKQNRKSAKAHLVMAGIFRENGNILAAKDQLRKAKKYISPKEKEMIEKYVTNENKRLIEYVDKVQVKGFSGQKMQSLIPTVEGEKPFIAVFAFDDDGEGTNNIGETVSEMLITGLIQTNKFHVVERSQLKNLLEEQALGQTGVIDEETAVDVGALLGVDAIVVGNVGLLKRQMEIDARLVNPENGKVLLASSATAPDESRLRNTVNELADKFAAESEKITVLRNETSK